MRKLIIFGKGAIAQIAKDYFTNDSNYDVTCFTLDKEYIDADHYEGLPMVPFSEIEKTFSPIEYDMFIALSYSQMNKLRERKYHEAKKKGYHLVSYISSKCTYLTKFKCGENCFILEDNTIQPYVQIGNNVILWSGNHIGHHSIIHDHCFVSSHVVVSGHCIIESNCFIGVNATIGHKIRIAKETLLGAGVVITKDTEDQRVYVASKPIMLEKRSDQIKL